MKVFWALIGMVILAAGAFLFVSGRQHQQVARQRTQAVEASEEAREEAELRERMARAKAEAEKASSTVGVPTDGEKVDAGPTPIVAERVLALADRPGTTASTPAKAPEPAPTAANPKPVPEPAKAIEGLTTPIGTPPDVVPPMPKPAAKKVNEDELFDTAPAEIVHNDDGTTTIDEKYTIKGEGTTESPYEVPWEMLTSAEHTYNPAEGKKKISQGIMMLDGKHVRVSGYVAFPMMMQQPRELLSMLNPWDGCCIGVPPTPYDAIEVRLKDKVTGQKRFASSGVVTGILRVKPYLTGKWLIGLYVMDEGVLGSEKYGAGGT